MKIDLNQRGLLVPLLTAAVLLSSQVEASEHENDRAAFQYNPDFQTTIAGKTVGVDIALLDPQTGAATTGFYASLDPHHGEPFSQGWNAFYKHIITIHGTHNINPVMVQHVKNHLMGHGISGEDIENAYLGAKSVWDKNTQLRVNVTGTNVAFVR